MDVVLDFIDFIFDLLCTALGFMFLFRCISYLSIWTETFQQILGG